MIKALAQWLCRDTCYNCKGRDILCHYSTRGDNCAVSNCDFWFDLGIVPDPCVMSDRNTTRSTLFKPIVIYFYIIPIIGGTVQKMMHAR